MKRLTFGVIACLAAAIPAGSASALNILVYGPFAIHSLGQTAATGIDAAGTTVTTPANFNAMLGSQGWDVVVVDSPSAIPTGGWAPLIAFVNGGGKCVMSFWDWDNSSGQGAAGLPQAFGATTTSGKLSLTDGVTSYVATAAGIAQGLYLGVTMPNNGWHNHWGDDGDMFTLAAGSTSLGTIGGGAVTVLGNGGRTIATFVIDEAGTLWLDNGSAVNLWRNMIRAVAGSPCDKSIEFDGTPGTAAPPATLGFYQMSAFPANTPCPPASTSSVASPLGGSVGFSVALVHGSVAGGPVSTCASWATWSHGYTGDVYETDFAIGSGAITITMPAATGAFYMYMEPNNFGIFTLTATANDGTSSGPISVDGSAGARYYGFFATGGSINRIVVANTDGLAAGFAIGEFGIAREGQVVFNGAPGTGAPPATLGPYTITAFPLNTVCPPLTVTSVPSPLAGSVGFSATLNHDNVTGGPASACGPWATWSHGYTGDVFATDTAFGSGVLTLTLPAGTGAFRMYVEPNLFGMFTIVATSNTGVTSGPISVEGSAGARYIGFFANGGASISFISVSQTTGTSSGFAVGEFGIANAACPPACLGGACPADLSGDGPVNSTDLGILLSSWSIPGTVPGCMGAIPCCADLNGDGFVNSADLGILLVNWVGLPGGDPDCP